jgi:outer membrane protein assembly factor BamB
MTPNSNGAMARSNIHGTGVYTTRGIQQLHGELWRSKVDYGAIGTSGAIYEGTIYFGANDGSIYALDANNGKRKWRFQTGAFPTSPSPPAVADNTVYVGGMHTFYALDSRTGLIRWQYAPEDATDGTFLISPTVVEGVVYSGGWHRLYALNATTGREIWKVRFNGEIVGMPVISDDTIYIGTNSLDGREVGAFYALDIKSGRGFWTIKAGDFGVGGGAAIEDGTIYIGTWAEGLCALEAKTGQKKWQYNPNGRGVVSSPAVAYNTVYFTTKGALYAVDSKTGRERWRLYTGDFFYSDPIIADGMVYFITSDNEFSLSNLFGSRTYLHAVDAESGVEKWKYTVSGLSTVTPAVADGIMYLGTEEGYLYAIK